MTLCLGFAFILLKDHQATSDHLIFIQVIVWECSGEPKRTCFITYSHTICLLPPHRLPVFLLLECIAQPVKYTHPWTLRTGQHNRACVFFLPLELSLQYRDTHVSECKIYKLWNTRIFKLGTDSLTNRIKQKSSFQRYNSTF